MKRMLLYRFNSRACLLVTATMFVSLLACADDNCASASSGVKQQLGQIHQDLQKAITLQEYQRSIEKRYDMVDALLANTEQCLKQGSDSELSVLKKTLKTLRSDARTLAFTKFTNWMEFRKEELALLHNVVSTKDPAPVSVTEAAVESTENR